MTPDVNPSALRSVWRWALPRDGGPLGDRQLLDGFRAARDEAAFAALVRRHGPLVLGVCRRVLGDGPDADDAFQATFLVLARKAGSLRQPERLAAWLYGVAGRTARKARGRRAARRAREGPLPEGLAAPPAPGPCDWRPLLDEEVDRLPAAFREALVLCDLQGLARAEAAARLGVAEGTLSSRLARGRAKLRDRLIRRGVTLAAGSLALEAGQPTVSAAVAGAVAKEAVGFVRAGAAATPAAVLAQGVIHAMTMSKLHWVVGVGLAVGVLGGGAGVAYLPTPQAEAKADEPKAAPQDNEAARLRKELFEKTADIADLKAALAQLREKQAQLDRQTALAGFQGRWLPAYHEVAGKPLLAKDILKDIVTVRNDRMTIPGEYRFLYSDGSLALTVGSGRFTVTVDPSHTPPTIDGVGQIPGKVYLNLPGGPPGLPDGPPRGLPGGFAGGVPPARGAAGATLVEEGAPLPRNVVPPRILGIYRLDGDALTICFDPEGKTRPREFKTKPGTHEEMYIFVRDPAD
jgi:RNA polymerase sigma factor (sigma-70 family)